MTGRDNISKPLDKTRVVVTRAVEQAGGLSAKLREAGADVVEFPTIITAPPEDMGPLDDAIDGLAGFDYIIFTSVNALKYFADRLDKRGVEVDTLGSVPIVVVGPKTAELLSGYGLKPSIVPKEFVAEGVMAELTKLELKGKRFLFPRAEVAREVIPDSLRELGAEVVVATAYRTLRPEVEKAEVDSLFMGGGIDAITFTSSSTVSNFVKIVGDRYREYLEGVAVACIGPVTKETCEELGIDVAVMPGEYTVDALFDSLVQHITTRR
jgi:uroporphyrinogen III methyltransferase/synthase